MPHNTQSQNEKSEGHILCHSLLCKPQVRSERPTVFLACVFGKHLLLIIERPHFGTAVGSDPITMWVSEKVLSSVSLLGGIDC